jgi:hypothetical protein
MARPRKEGLDYFPHDCDAASDEKVETLMYLHGAKGYTFYFVLLERIYRSKTFELDVSDAETRQILSRKMVITIEDFDQILETAIRYKCFDQEIYHNHQRLTSEGIRKRAETVISKRERMRNKSASGVLKAETREVMPEEIAQIKVKDSKVKKSKAKDHNDQKRYAENDDLESAIRSFIEFRRSLKKPMTDRAIKLLQNKLNEMSIDPYCQIQILEQSIVNGWTGIYPANNQKQETSDNPFLKMIRSGDL